LACVVPDAAFTHERRHRRCQVHHQRGGIASIDELLAMVNGTRFGLSTSVFSRDLDTGWSVADRVRAGMVHVNDGTAMHESHVPPLDELATTHHLVSKGTTG
jgi:hypothetical protein